VVAWTAVGTHICKHYSHTYNHKVLHLRGEKLRFFQTHRLPVEGTIKVVSSILRFTIKSELARLQVRTYHQE